MAEPTITAMLPIFKRADVVTLADQNDFVTTWEAYFDQWGNLTTDEINTAIAWMVSQFSAIQTYSDNVFNQPLTGGYSQSYINNALFESYIQYTAAGGETQFNVVDNSNVQIYKNGTLLVLGTDYTLNGDGINIDLDVALVLNDFMQSYDLKKISVLLDQKASVNIEKIDKSILITPPTDTDYTLTDAENLYGRIEVDTSNWTISRNIITNNIAHLFVGVVNTSGTQSATFKTSAGTGITIKSGEYLDLYNDGTDVLESVPLVQYPGSLTTDNMIHIQDQKTAGTDGGTFTAGAWQTRDLNTILTNTITGASLLANQITLPAGTYYVQAQAPVYNVERHKAKLANITDVTDILFSSGGNYAANGFATTDDAKINGLFTIAATKVIELQHRCSVTVPTTGFGWSVNAAFTVPYETFSDIKIWKVG